MESLGFIGMGNMAQALAQGFIASGALAKEHVFAFAPHQDKLKKTAERIGFQPVASLADLAAAADTLVMACKPYQIEGVVAELGDALSGKALVSIAAGWDFAHYEKVLPPDVRFQFVMPNTPAMVGEGVLLFEEKTSLEPAERKALMDLFATVGVVEEVPSALMAAAGTVTGCGPAFVDLMIEAYADAAVKYGVPREQAYALVAQMVKGSAALALETKEQPGVLKDAVCSPGGTTIRGVCSLEEDGFRAACIHSIDAILE
ncbi:MAG: pyrroline-5-carboxylate reductase [Olsenella sp.]|nr:pyrroline-5-carboxylate reductase [Olsenella sp.]MDY5275067.1 pyrroline-5-carboxylate reductase [Atopobiaceae bacterium]